jgi:hypothetical protein
MFEVGGQDRTAVRPDSAMSEAGRKFEGEALLEVGKIALEKPGLFGEVGMAALFILVGNDAAGVTGRSVDRLNLVVLEKVALTRVAILDHFPVLNDVHVAVDADDPDMEKKDLCVSIERDGDNAIVTTLSAEDLEDVTVMLGRTAVKGDRIGDVVHKNDSFGFGRVVRMFL